MKLLMKSSEIVTLMKPFVGHMLEKITRSLIRESFIISLHPPSAYILHQKVDRLATNNPSL